jgi:hypothetical protein
MPDFAKAVGIARQYVTNTQLNNSPQDEAPFVNEFNCPDKGDHPTIVCKEKVVEIESLVTPSTEVSNDDYIISLRSEPVRELLLIPRPNDDEQVNYRHFTNETLVQQEAFWKHLLYQRQCIDFYN